MTSTGHLAAFLVASIMFIQVPGPSLLFTIGRALTVGRRDALLSVVGNAIGVMGQVLLVAVGLGPLIASSAEAFLVLKLAGAAYVAYLGIQAVRHRADARRALEEAVAPGPTTSWTSVRTGILVGVTNPKTIVFFVAFLPQFVDAGSPAGPQIVLLGAIFAVMACASDSVWAMAAGRARTWFARKPARLDNLGVAGGVMMVGLGAALVTSSGSH